MLLFSFKEGARKWLFLFLSQPVCEESSSSDTPRLCLGPPSQWFPWMFRGEALGLGGQGTQRLPLGDKTERQRKAQGHLPTRNKASLGFRETGSEWTVRAPCHFWEPAGHPPWLGAGA